MMTTGVKTVVEPTDKERQDLYQLLEEGYRAMLEGSVCSLEEVRKEIHQRRLERG